MRREAVSVFRERGLRAGVSRSAGPQCLAANSNTERKTDTMKNYVLLKPAAVQNQLSNVCAQTKLFVWVTDYQQLANVALEAKANLEVKQAEVVSA
jgi:hypothetical protein